MSPHGHSILQAFVLNELACIDQRWRVRSRRMAPSDRADAEKAYEEARAIYRRIEAESPAER